MANGSPAPPDRPSISQPFDRSPFTARNSPAARVPAPPALRPPRPQDDLLFPCHQNIPSAFLQHPPDYDSDETYDGASDTDQDPPTLPLTPDPLHPPPSIPYGPHSSSPPVAPQQPLYPAPSPALRAPLPWTSPPAPDPTMPIGALPDASSLPSPNSHIENGPSPSAQPYTDTPIVHLMDPQLARPHRPPVSHIHPLQAARLKHLPAASPPYYPPVYHPPPSKHKPPAHRIHAACALYPSISLLCLLTALLFSLSVTSFLYRGTEPKNCRMSYMRPSYTHLDSFDHQNYTRHFSKYSLYLYREKGIDDLSPNPSGIPVLFIPGNSGSYRQVRALAAKSANKFSDCSHPQFDYYTADFNEDLTAFHGRSLLDQAEYLNDAIKYILSLYPPSSSLPSPTSVILVAHSMGGVVARAMFLLDNYQKNSVNTIFTLSAPHTLPPAPFDKDLVAVYDQVNAYWEQSYSQDFIGRNPLALVSLISITGGSLDHMITSESASVASIVPPSNGFTVFTNSIPNVWTSIDHQAIVWCDQFRDVFANTMSAISDLRVPSKTRPLPTRMNIFRKHFLGGFEVGASPEYLQTRYHPSLNKECVDSDPTQQVLQNLQPPTGPLHEIAGPMNDPAPADAAFTPPAIGDYDTLLWIEDITKFAIPPNQKLVISLGDASNGGRAYFMPIVSDISQPGNKGASGTAKGSNGDGLSSGDLEFTFLTDSILLSSHLAKPSAPHPSLGADSVSSGIYTLVCRYPHAEPRHPDKTLTVIDLTKRAHSASHMVAALSGDAEADDTRLVGLLCKNIAADASTLPNPLAHADDTSRPDMGRMAFIKYNAAQLADYDFVTIIDTNTHRIPGFALAEFAERSQSQLNARAASTWDLVSRGVSVTLPASRPFMVDVSFEQMWSSLISYTMKIEETHQTGPGKLFQPFVRQYSGESYESKFYLGSLATDWVPISMTGVAPFSPFGVRESDSDFETNLFYYGQQSHYYHNLHLQLWTDASLESSTYYTSQSDRAQPSPLRITLRIDWFGSMGNLVMHYRIAIVAFSIAIIAIVLLIQFYIYNKQGLFISVPQALHIFIHKYLLYLCLATLVLPYVPSVTLFRDILYFLEPGMDVYSGDGPASIFTNIRRNQFFLGLEPGHLLFLGPVFVCAGIGLVSVTFYLLYIVVATASVLPHTWSSLKHGIGVALAAKLKPAAPPPEPSPVPAAPQTLDESKPASPQTSPGPSLQHRKKPAPREPPKSPETVAAAPDAQPDPGLLQANSETWTSTRFKTARRAVVTSFLFVAVAYTVPCEFAYLVACFAQLATAVKAHFRWRAGHARVVPSSGGPGTPIACFFNFAMAVLVLMVWIIPITAPILVVWGRKLSAHWNEAFASHHNLLAIGPTLFFVETVASGTMVPRAEAPALQCITYLSLAYIVFHAVLMGVPRTYMLYHLVNVLSGWFLVGCVITAMGQAKRDPRPAMAPAAPAPADDPADAPEAREGDPPADDAPRAAARLGQHRRNHTYHAHTSSTSSLSSVGSAPPAVQATQSQGSLARAATVHAELPCEAGESQNHHGSWERVPLPPLKI